MLPIIFPFARYCCFRKCITSRNNITRWSAFLWWKRSHKLKGRAKIYLPCSLGDKYVTISSTMLYKFVVLSFSKVTYFPDFCCHDY